MPQTDSNNEFAVGDIVESPNLPGQVGIVVGVSIDTIPNVKTSWVTIRWNAEHDSLGPVSCFHHSNVRKVKADA